MPAHTLGPDRRVEVGLLPGLVENQLARHAVPVEIVAHELDQ